MHYRRTCVYYYGTYDSRWEPTQNNDSDMCIVKFFYTPDNDNHVQTSPFCISGDLKSFLLARRRLVDQQGTPEVRHGAAFRTYFYGDVLGLFLIDC